MSKTYIPNKTPLSIDQDIFDLKMLFVSDSGGGKTHLCGTYTLGPVHFYMLDKGGEVTLKKLLKNRPERSPITYDDLSDKKIKFSDFWKQLQKDEKEGFFEYMADQNGLVVVDSMTSANQKIVAEIGRLTGKLQPSPGKKADGKKKFSYTEWDQLRQWLGALIDLVQNVPCATVSTVHLIDQMNKEGSVIARKAAVNGQAQNLITINYDEVYQLTEKKGVYKAHFNNYKKFKGGSRAFSCQTLINPTLDLLAEAYLSGNLLEEKKK